MPSVLLPFWREETQAGGYITGRGIVEPFTMTPHSELPVSVLFSYLWLIHTPIK